MVKMFYKSNDTIGFLRSYFCKLGYFGLLRIARGDSFDRGMSEIWEYDYLLRRRLLSKNMLSFGWLNQSRTQIDMFSISNDLDMNFCELVKFLVNRNPSLCFDDSFLLPNSLDKVLNIIFIEMLSEESGVQQSIEEDYRAKLIEYVRLDSLYDFSVLYIDNLKRAHAPESEVSDYIKLIPDDSPAKVTLILHYI